jgi:hypothetical protein
MQTEISPLSSLREWIAALTRIVYNTAPRDIISWPSDNVMMLKGLTINIDLYCEKVRKSLQDTRVHIRERVLFGIATDIKIPPIDSQNETTHGHSIFGPVDRTFDNVDSAAFLGALLIDGKLCWRGPDNVIVWDRQRVDEWLSDIDRSWSDVYCLLHILCLPPRASEEIIFQWTNSKNGRRHLFIINQIMALISNYHKGHQVTGLYKQVLRLMPNELGLLIVILLRVVRPIEILVVGKFYTPETQKSAMKKRYASKMFVTYGQEWKSERLSRLLKGWWTKNMNLPIGINLHRQFSVGLQRRFQPYDKTDPRRKTAQLALAHGEIAGDLYYAKATGDSNIPLTRQALFEEISHDWMALFGFKNAAVYRESLWDDEEIFETGLNSEVVSS